MNRQALIKFPMGDKHFQFLQPGGSNHRLYFSQQYATKGNYFIGFSLTDLYGSHRQRSTNSLIVKKGNIILAVLEAQGIHQWQIVFRCRNS
jgi:hypothetical protein